MIKVSRLFKRLPGMSLVDFSQRWQADYALAMQALASDVAGVDRYSQSHAAGHESPVANAPVSAFDGVDEIWCRSVDAAVAFFNAAPYRDVLAVDERRFIDHAASAVVVGEVHTMWQRAARPQADAVKLMILPVRRAQMSVPEFLHHWMKVHSPLTLKGPHTRERVQRIEFCPQFGLGLAGLAVAACEGTGSIWFDSASQMQAEFTSDYYRSTLQPDEPRFSDASRSRGLMLKELRVWERARQDVPG